MTPTEMFFNYQWWSIVIWSPLVLMSISGIVYVMAIKVVHAFNSSFEFAGPSRSVHFTLTAVRWRFISGHFLLPQCCRYTCIRVIIHHYILFVFYFDPRVRTNLVICIDPKTPLPPNIANYLVRKIGGMILHAMVKVWNIYSFLSHQRQKLIFNSFALKNSKFLNSCFTILIIGRSDDQ